MAYTLGEAARATGRSKTALQDAIKKGRISAEKDPFGCWRIDPAELHRVYPLRPDTGPHLATNPNTQPCDTDPHRTPDRTPDQAAEIARLQERVAGMERLFRQVEDERDSLRAQNARLTALLPQPQASAAGEHPAKPAFWRRLRLFS